MGSRKTIGRRIRRQALRAKLGIPTNSKLETTDYVKLFTSMNHLKPSEFMLQGKVVTL